jgi:hypothetical protein
VGALCAVSTSLLLFHSTGQCPHCPHDSRRGPRRIHGRQLLGLHPPRRGASLGCHFASLAIIGALPSYSVALACLAVGSFGLYSAAVVLHAMRDAATDLDTRGRIYGANTTMQTIVRMLSMIAGDLCADLFGAGPVFLAGGSAALAALVAAGLAIGTREWGQRKQPEEQRSLSGD